MYTTVTNSVTAEPCSEGPGRLGRSRRHGKSHVRRGLVAAIATAATLGLIPAVASAYLTPVATSQTNVALTTGSSSNLLVLDVSGASKAVGAAVIQWYDNGGSNQRWNFVPNLNGFDHIVNVNSGLCLATNGAPGNQITQWPCSTSTQEDWRPTVPSTGSFFNPESGLYLDIDGNSPWPGAHLIAWYANLNAGQVFRYVQH